MTAPSALRAGCAWGLLLLARPVIAQPAPFEDLSRSAGSTAALATVASARWLARLEEHWRRGEHVSLDPAVALAAARRARAKARGGFEVDRRIAEHEAGLWERDASR